MRYIVDGITEVPHPEEQPLGGVSKDASRLSSPLPNDGAKLELLMLHRVDCRDKPGNDEMERSYLRVASN